jgi:membrane protease YdiL (CAAX protease family)
VTMPASSTRLVADVGQLNAACLWILTALCLAIWCYLGFRWRKGGELIPDRRPPEAPWGLMDVWIIILLWFGGSFGLALAQKLGINERSTLSFVYGLMTLGATVAGLLWLVIRYRASALFLISPRRPGHDIALGLVAFIAIVPPIFWLMTLLVRFSPYHHETLALLQKSPSPWVIFVSFFTAALVAPIAEEFFFRLVLQSWLQRLRFRDVPAHRFACIYGDDRFQQVAHETVVSPQAERAPRWPILVSAALFAGLHADQWPAPVALFVLGLALGYLFQKTGSLIPCIVLHMGLNAYSLIWQTWLALEETVNRGIGN